MLLRSFVGSALTVTIYQSSTARVASFEKMCLDYIWSDEPRVNPDIVASEVPIGPQFQCLQDAHLASRSRTYGIATPSRAMRPKALTRLRLAAKRDGLLAIMRVVTLRAVSRPFQM